MSKIIKFFRDLITEVFKIIHPAPVNLLSLDESKEILKSKNKNELINILINIGSDLDRTLPQISNRKELKQTHSKGQIIKAILLLLYEKYKIQGAGNAGNTQLS